MHLTILAGSSDGLFELTANGCQQRLPGRSVANLTLAHDGGWWAILDRRYIVRSADAVEWHEVAELTRAEGACIAVDGEALWIGTFPPHLYYWDGERLEQNEAFEEISGKDSWYTPWGGPPETRSLALTPDRTIFANVHVGGIPRSVDGGASWQPTIDVRSDVHQVSIHPQVPNLILAASARGLGISRDGGDSWEMHRQGVHGHYMSAIAISGTTVFVTSSTGSSSQARSAIYRVDLENLEVFEKVSNGLPEWFTGNINTFCLDADRRSIAFGTVTGKLFIADVGDLHWRQVADGLPEVRSAVISADHG